MRMIRIITQIMRLIDVIKLMRIMRIIILLLYIHFHHFVNINNSDYSNLFLPLPVYPNFVVVPDEPPSHEQQPLHDSSMNRHGSSSTNRHSCRTRCASQTLIPAAPRRATISTGHDDRGDHGSTAVQRSALRSRWVR